MKTIDELIEAQKRCATYPNCHFCFLYAGPLCTWIRDVIEYLQEYRDNKESLRYWTEKAISEQQNLSDTITFMQAYRDDKDDLTALRAYWKEHHENDPLSFDELREMEGKPVWIEDGLENGEWYIIECFTESGRFIAHDRYADDTVFKAIDMGNMWQAYRKERC